MSRLGLGLSITLHVLLFVAVLIGPRPPKFEWEPQDAVAVELVQDFDFPEPANLPAPQARPEKAVDPERKPPVTESERVPEIIEEPDPEPEPQVEEPKTDPPAEKPAEQPKPTKPRRKFQRIGHKAQEDDGPTLEERLQKAMNRDASESSPPVDPAPTAETPEVLSPATPSTEVQATDFPFAWYLNQVRNKTHDAWDPPGDRMIASRANVVLVQIRIERDGRVTKIDVAPSGNPSLDASVKRAVQAAQPFGILPDAWDEDFLDLGVRFSVGGSS